MSEIIETICGKLRGQKRDGYVLYRGVPYAEPPVGALRWRPPVKKAPWEGVLEADDWKNISVQPPNISEMYRREFYSDPAYERPMSEDCLYLHIWTPDRPGKYPVAVWIHGGAFMAGFSSEIEFDGAEYARRGVILVSVEYRCNLFGFLCHPWLSEESEAGRSGNYGILDQLCAIEWVKENISAFGGDPDNITLFGQSAGAMSVQTIVSSPKADGLVAKAILQSGGTYLEGLHRDLSMKEAEAYGVMLSDILGVHSLNEMRAVPAEKLLAVLPELSMKVSGETMQLFLIPVIDGDLMTSGYYQAMDAGQILDIPFMLGSVKNDILCQPNASAENSPLHRGAVAFSMKLEELGRNPAYVYYFSRNLPGDVLGAWHSSELWYMFGTLNRSWRPFEEHDRQLSRGMLDYWTNFMKSGNPNLPDSCTWQTCSADNPFVMEFK